MPLLLAFLAALGVPLLLAAWARIVALRRGATDPTAAWFAYAQQLGWISLLGWMVWLTLAPPLVRAATTTLQRSLPPLGTIPVFVFTLLALPALLGAALSLLRYEASRRLRLVDRGWRLELRDAGLQLAIALVPLPLGAAALPAFASGHRALGVGLCVGAAASLVVLAVRRRALAGLSPHAVMSGEIRDRVFALAARAGVELRHLYVVPLGSQRLANAFAVRADTVVLTDYLIEQLDRDELDAVLAHEMAHLKLGHPRKLGLAVMLSGVATYAAITVSGAGATWIVALVLGSLGVMAFSRRLEYAADAGAVALGAKPEALITGLARLGRLNHIPLRWTRLREWTVTHPSTERRAAAIARAAGLDPARASLLLDSPPAAGERYALPAALAAGRAFTTAFKNGTNSRVAWSLFGVLALTPVLFSMLAGFLALPSALRLAAAAASAIAALALGHLVARRIAASRLRALEQAATPLLAGALPHGTRARFLGLAPAMEPRLYEGLNVWDAGLLALEPGRLDWSGEEARFTLAASDVREVSVAAGFPRWDPGADVRVRWERPDGLRGVFRLVMMTAGGRRAAGEARDLMAWIEAWRRHPDTHSSGAPWLGAPPTSPVTSASPRATLEPRRLLATWIVLTLLTLAACAALELSWGLGGRAGFVDALLAALASHALLLLPLVRYREPAESAAEGAQPERRVA